MRLQRGEQLGVACRRITMKRRRKMSAPRAIDLFAIQHANENLRIRVRHGPERIRPNERVDIDHAAPSNEPAPKIRAADRQRMSFMSSEPSNPVVSSARSLASPVHIVTSLPQSR